MFDRRQFLTTTAAAALATAASAPFGRRAHAADTTPCRFVFVVEGNCVEPVTMLSDLARAQLDLANKSPVGEKRWWYNDYQHADAPLEFLDSGLATARSLASLAPVVGVPGQPDKIGLEGKAAVVYGLSNKISGGGHSTNSGALACSRPSGATPTGPTIDGFLAALPQVRQGKPFEAIRLGIAPNGFTSRLNYRTCAIAAGRPAPLIVDPTTAYINLFGSVDETYEAAFAQRTKLLSLAMTRTQAKISNFKAACSQRDKLVAYNDSLNELSIRQASLESLKSDLTAAKDALLYTDQLTSTHPHQRLAAQFEMATAGLVAGLSNVAVIGIGTGGTFDLEYPDYGEELKRHDCHHLAQNSADAQVYRDVIHDVSAEQIGMVATMARTFESITESGGTMLDNTLIVYLGGNGEQHHSSASEFPVLMLGGSNLGLKTDGRTVVYPGLAQGGHRQLSSLFTTFAHAVGEPIESFGNEGPTLTQTGPLGELMGAGA